MIQVWRNYLTDSNFSYPFVSVRLTQLNEIIRDDSPLLELPTTDQNATVEIDSPCDVRGITQRRIRLFFTDESIYELNYYKPFDLSLFNWLTANDNVRAFQLIGEQIRHFRLRKMFDRE